MTGHGRSHRWACDGIGPPNLEPGPANQNFFPQKRFITDRNNPQFHQLSGWLVSDDPTGEEAGCGGPGLACLHVVCGCEAGWTRLMVKKGIFNSLATALVDIPAVSMPIARSLKT